jgi:hypothetical protein
MTTYAIHLKETEPDKIKLFEQMVQSLDFVHSIEKMADLSEAPQATEDIPAGFMTKNEICERYPDEWVLLFDAQTDGIGVVGGKILLHDKDKRALALKARDIIKKYKNTTHFFAGEKSRHATSGLARTIRPET